MSRFLLLNFEDFGLSQDITQTIQPFSPFCICCLDREGPLFDLEKCKHSDYLDAFNKPELKLFNQLVCLQCHSLLKKIKCFQKQIMETCSILMSGAFTDTTVNDNRMSRLSIQKVIDNLNLPCDLMLGDSLLEEDESLSNICIEDSFNDVIQHSSLEGNFTHEISDMLTEEQDLIHEQNLIQEDNLILEQDLIQEHSLIHDQNLIPEDNMIQAQNVINEQNLIQEQSLIQVQNLLNENLINDQSLIVQEDLIQENVIPEQSMIQEQNVIQEQNRLNKNIKTALEILERNNQSFVHLGSQLQLLDGEDLTSLLGPSLLSKEILTDMPLVPAENLSTDLENGLLNNPKSLEMNMAVSDKMFYDSLNLSPGLMDKRTDTPEVIELAECMQKEIEPKAKNSVTTKLKRASGFSSRD